MRGRVGASEYWGVRRTALSLGLPREESGYQIPAIFSIRTRV